MGTLQDNNRKKIIDNVNVLNIPYPDWTSLKGVMGTTKLKHFPKNSEIQQLAIIFFLKDKKPLLRKNCELNQFFSSTQPTHNFKVTAIILANLQWSYNT